MKNKLSHPFLQLPTYLFLGVAIALVVGLFVMVSYVLVWGVALGAVIWLVATLKNLLFPQKTHQNTRGRIIEHEKDSKKK